MTNGYTSAQQAASYSAFLQSEDGKIQCEVIHAELLPHLPKGVGATVLDVGCGNGWLCGAMTAYNIRASGCDVSSGLIEEAKARYPKANFTVANADHSLPYEDAAFDCVVMSLVSHDFQNPAAALKEVHRVLRPGGKLLNVIVNPHYGFPVGVWKRPLWAKLFPFVKPRLELRSYEHYSKKENRRFSWGDGLFGNFVPFEEQVSDLVSAGFELVSTNDITSEQDSATYNLRYRLHRAPIYQLLVLKKLSE